MPVAVCEDKRELFGDWMRELPDEIKLGHVNVERSRELMQASGSWKWPTVNAPYGGSGLARLTVGDLDSGLEGCLRAESAKRDETPGSVCDGPLATA